MTTLKDKYIQARDDYLNEIKETLNNADLKDLSHEHRNLIREYLTIKYEKGWSIYSSQTVEYPKNSLSIDISFWDNEDGESNINIPEIESFLSYIFKTEYKVLIDSGVDEYNYLFATKEYTEEQEQKRRARRAPKKCRKRSRKCK